jgi:hypothetical protein
MVHHEIGGPLSGSGIYGPAEVLRRLRPLEACLRAAFSVSGLCGGRFLFIARSRHADRVASNVRVRGQSGKHMLVRSSSQFDPHRTSISKRKRVTLRSHWAPNYAHRPSPEICSRDEIDEEPNTRRNHRLRAAPQRAWEMNRFAVQSRRRACLPSRRHSAPRSCPSSQCSTRL